ncbi:hypothetical protein [Chitinophaga sp. MM2321]|uniref:hypothetical protein n=1 Tax=Chitinophaga sp. MM2321 TaxID=3137178 RepID=UPI0032D5B05A
MKKYILYVLIFISASCFAQNKNINTPQDQPFKGAKKINLSYPISGDSLFTYISKSLIKSGYAILSRDKELGTIATDVKHIKYIDYKMNLVINGNKVIITGQGNTGIGIRLGSVYSEPSWVDIEYRGKADMRRSVFDDMVRFAQTTIPETIEYSR